MKKIWANAQEKAQRLYNDHKYEIAAGAIIAVGWVVYSKIFDYGYNCRVDFEKACDAETGSNIVDILNAYDA